MKEVKKSDQTRSSVFIFITFLVLLGASAGCAGQKLPFLPSSADCSDDTALFRDDFENTNCGWALFEGAESADIHDGILQIDVSTVGLLAWSYAPPEFTDIQFSAQTRQIGGSNDNSYGLICRYQDPKNFYVFLISGDGYYAIGKYTEGKEQIKYLTGSSPNYYLFSESINQGIATNRLRIQCVDDRLSLYVNGFLLAEVEDSSLTQGKIGVAATTYQPGNAVIEFDNALVETP